MAVLDGSSILVTGGTGSFGSAFIAHALTELNPRRLVVLSRDELKQYELRQRFCHDPRLRWFIGDIRDRRRLERAMFGVDHVVHAAALKQIDTGPDIGLAYPLEPRPDASRPHPVGLRADS